VCVSIIQSTLGLTVSPDLFAITLYLACVFTVVFNHDIMELS
jgi:hypothetical protein